MFSSARPSDVLRSVICLSLLGVAVLVLSGPVLAVVCVVLPFALIGGLAWGAYRGVRTLVIRMLRGRPRIERMDDASSLEPIPVVLHRSPERPALRPRGAIGSKLRTAMYVGIEVGCGAALGAGLSLLISWQAGSGIQHPALGAAIGAVVGFVVGGTRPRSAANETQGTTPASQAA